ncbi:hypothetical protein JS533_011000 [Bifidobacterium amazonense]|uniref:Uncharacterized protein n=1 Tax=Bifidobacterium amazonense TaxID=2809027 RepID=A0ABS9VXE9_9BIFI|nr:hypothetical protein [Bifidobacterium amazonense]MCH9276794.1 hypothetical protein [Bifidobacterium amazonense]
MESRYEGNATDFVGYEYTIAHVGTAYESMVADGYRNFGWVPDGPERSGHGELRFKRDRSLPNRAGLTRLQRQFDSHIRELERLENAPARTSSIVGLSAGLIGCVFLGGATFSYLGGLMALMVVLAIPGFLCWLGAWPAAKRARSIVTARNEPAIDHLHDMNYDVCRHANSLLMRGDVRTNDVSADESQASGAGE